MREPGACKLLMWTAMQSDNGADLWRLVDAIGIPHDRIGTIPESTINYGVPAVQLAQAVAACDVLLSATLAEGFCCPVLEAAAVGVPSVITTNTGAHSASGGILAAAGCAQSDPPIRAVYGIRHWADPPGAWQVIPDPESIAEALESLLGVTLDSSGVREAYSPAAIAGLWAKALDG